MNVTTKEANGIGCPKAMFEGSNRKMDGNWSVRCLCLAPNCMLWRWDNKNKQDEHDKGHCGLITNFVSRV